MFDLTEAITAIGEELDQSAARDAELNELVERLEGYISIDLAQAMFAVCLDRGIDWRQLMADSARRLFDLKMH